MTTITTTNPSAAVTMTSLELVDFINASRKEGEAALRHDSFMAKVPKVLGENHAPKFIGTQTYGNNNTRAIYIFPKREACLMAMSYSYELQAKVFDRMTELEAQVQQPQLPDFGNPVAAARAWADAVEAKQAALLELQDATEQVDFLSDTLNRFADRTGSTSLTDAAKVLQVPPRQFTQLLSDNGFIFKRTPKSSWTAYQKHIDNGNLITKVTEGEQFVALQTRVTAQGMVTISNLLTLA